MEFQIDANNVEECFKSIAFKLINQYDLQVNHMKYQFIDLEFYFYCDKHQDGYTYKHDEHAGKIRFHYSGMDITLGAYNNSGYGGILIRGIQDNDSHKIIGPLRVLKEFSKSFGNIMEDTSFRLAESSPTRHLKIGQDISLKQRVNLKRPIDKSEYKNSFYRYVVK